MPARARRSRQRSIRALLALGLIVPVLGLLALWGFGTNVTVTHATAEHDFTAADQLYTGPAQAVSSALSVEQLQAVTWLSSGAHAPLAALRAQFGRTNRAAVSFLAAARAHQAVIPSAARPALRAVESMLAGRATLRADVRAGRLDALAAVQAYGAILTAIVSFDAKLLAVDDASLSRQAAASVEADHGVALASSEIALASGAVAAGGAMSTDERVLFAQDAAGARLMLSDALSALNPALGSGYLRASNSAAYRDIVTAEGQIAASAGDAGLLPVDASRLAASVAALSTEYQAAQRQDAVGLANLAAQASGPAMVLVVLVAGLGLVAVLLSVLLAIWVWWRIVHDVTRLQGAALTLPSGQLARPSKQPSEDDAGQGTGAAMPLPAGRIRELAQASAALSAARQLTVQAVATQSQLRSGASRLLRNLGLRSHALAQRQLRLLAVIERGITDPQTLAGLAAVGQLTTRLQRQADGLLVLSGGSPARTGDATLPIGDLLRAATAEVDEGSRVTIVSDSADLVTADAVADVLHLITELVENAVEHTPPLAEVTVRVGRVGRGLVVEVEDHGPGMAKENLESLNALLAEPPDIGLSAAEGVGLLIAARLAARHGITVSLRRSPTAGTTAIVLLPHAILITGEVRDTIFDGSLPRIDAELPPVVPPPTSASGPAPSTVFQPAQSASGPAPSSVFQPAASALGPLPARVPQPAPRTPGARPGGPTDAAPPAPGPLPSRLPRHGAHPEAAQPTRRDAPSVRAEREPAVPVATAPAGESLAPWHWLTESQPARTSAADPPDSQARKSRDSDGDPAVPTPLPRRIRAGLPFGRAAPATGGPDQSPAPGPADAAHRTDGDPDDGPAASLADDPARGR
jgi:signal transduction histidine kinase